MAERRIDGLGTIKSEPMPAGDAIELYADIMRIAGRAAPKIPGIVAAASSDDEGAQGIADLLALQAIADVLATTTSADIRETLRRILESAMLSSADTGGGYRQLFLNDFTGKLGLLAPTIRFILEVQYKDFFIGSGQNGILAMLRMGPARKS